mgnify:CR=1 FL=1
MRKSSQLEARVIYRLKILKTKKEIKLKINPVALAIAPLLSALQTTDAIEYVREIAQRVVSRYKFFAIPFNVWSDALKFYGANPTNSGLPKAKQSSPPSSSGKRLG